MGLTMNFYDANDYCTDTKIIQNLIKSIPSNSNHLTVCCKEDKILTT